MGGDTGRRGERQRSRGSKRNRKHTKGDLRQALRSR